MAGIISRALSENNPKILEESGLSLEEISNQLKQTNCMLENIAGLDNLESCQDVNCYQCRFDCLYTSVEETKQWLKLK